jgi:ribosomal protein S18 acetylase RimI-like enzyme
VRDGGARIRSLTPADGGGCDAVLASLPYFFGDPDGIAQCHEAVRTQRGFVAEEGAEIVGFVTLDQHHPGSAEITWLAVRAGRRRSGIGRALIDASVGLLRAEGQRMLFVLTLGPSVPETQVSDNYEGTREFYRRVGFVALREFGLRDWNDAFALVLARGI